MNQNILLKLKPNIESKARDNKEYKFETISNNNIVYGKKAESPLPNVSYLVL